MDIITRKQAREQGLKRYFTGKPCNHGHLSLRSVSTSKCLECHKVREAARYANPEYRLLTLEQQRRARTEFRKDPDWSARRKESNKKSERKFAGLNGVTRATAARHRSPVLKLIHFHRVRINQAITATRQGRAFSSQEVLGCSPKEFMDHLESQFLEGMTWDNHGIHGWHVDHVRPCASFDLTDPEQQRQCFHYTNLQPLWAKDNILKSDKWDPATMEA